MQLRQVRSGWSVTVVIDCVPTVVGGDVGCERHAAFSLALQELLRHLSICSSMERQVTTSPTMTHIHTYLLKHVLCRFEETNSSQGALISQLGRLESSQPTAGTPSDSNIVFPVSRELLNATLQMVCYELYAQNAFKSAFKRLNEVSVCRDDFHFCIHTL